MSSIYLVYETDAWHSRSNSTLIGVCTTFSNCMKIIRADIKEFNRDKLSNDDKRMLERIWQTQDRSVNFMIDEVDKNTLL